MIITEEVYLEHFGVKGMRWGVRKKYETGEYRLQIPTPKVDVSLHKATQSAAKDISALIGERYGYQITAVKAIDPGHPDYARGLVGYVMNTPGRSGGEIYARQGDIRKALKGAEDIGWFGKDTGNVKGFLTHESAHAIFHAEQQVKPGFFKPKIVGGNHEARNKALKAAVKEAAKAGISGQMFSSSVSGYAAKAGMLEETEAELFSQYHWSPNRPAFVKTWGETLHKEMGIDNTPFREKTVNRG